jgi:hypothetical protein
MLTPHASNGQIDVVALGQASLSGRLAAQTPPAQTREVPMFEPDPSWLKRGADLSGAAGPHNRAVRTRGTD